jgi:hypothetical protein
VALIAGFKNTTSACCGAGPFNTAVSCGLEIPKDKRGEYTAFLCKRPEKYVFWDGTHPTEKVYRMVSRQIWHGNTSFITLSISKHCCANIEQEIIIFVLTLYLGTGQD